MRRLTPTPIVEGCGTAFASVRAKKLLPITWLMYYSLSAFSFHRSTCRLRDDRERILPFSLLMPRASRIRWVKARQSIIANRRYFFSYQSTRFESSRSLPQPTCVTQTSGTGKSRTCKELGSKYRKRVTVFTLCLRSVNECKYFPPTDGSIRDCLCRNMPEDWQVDLNPATPDDVYDAANAVVATGAFHHGITHWRLVCFKACCY